MKKPSSLAQQIQQAQLTIESWSDFRKSTLRLEGSDLFLTQRILSQSSGRQAEVRPSVQKKKAHA